jgi:hypothetical protein
MQKDNLLKAAMKYFASNDMTTIHDVDSLSSYGTSKKLKNSKELTVHIYGARSLNRWKELLNIDMKDDN